MRETDALQKQIAAFETQIVETMESLESVEKELEERADEIDSLDSKRAAALKEFDQAIAVDKTEFDSETALRKTAFATLPARLASVYDRLAQRSRDGIAVAEVVSGACSACYMQLRPQVVLNVKKGDEIVVCDAARLECLVKPLANGDTAQEASYRAFFGNPPVRMLPVTPATWDHAARLSATYRLKAMDSVHLATAIEQGCGLFLTSDATLARCTAITVDVRDA